MALEIEVIENRVTPKRKYPYVGYYKEYMPDSNEIMNEFYVLFTSKNCGMVVKNTQNYEPGGFRAPGEISTCWAEIAFTPVDVDVSLKFTTEK